MNSAQTNAGDVRSAAQAPSAPPLVLWVALPLSIAFACALLTHTLRAQLTPSFFQAPALVTKSELRRLEAAPNAQITDTVWALADSRTTRKLLQRELDRLYGLESVEHAVTLLRAALLDPSPDGRRALINQACVAHLPICDNIEQSLQQQLAQRLVTAPALPPGHPALDSAVP